ncbi:MAG TPA: hypothetical protein VIL30_00120 [Ramlibacter sp.]|jgi:hypothetical protein
MVEVLLVRLLARIVRIYDEFGQDACEVATHQALIAMARSMQELATSNAEALPTESNVVRFPRSGRHTELGQTDQDDA